VERSFSEGHARIFNDYFSIDPVYSDQVFERRFRMPRKMFLVVLQAVCQHDPYDIPDSEVNEPMQSTYRLHGQRTTACQCSPRLDQQITKIRSTLQ
jgi:hypothetical protein